MDNLIDGTSGKLGHGFTSAGELKEIDIGPRDRPRPTYVSAKSNPKYKLELVDLLKKFKDCFAWPGSVNYLNFEEFRCHLSRNNQWKVIEGVLSRHLDRRLTADSFSH